MRIKENYFIKIHCNPFIMLRIVENFLDFRFMSHVNYVYNDFFDSEFEGGCPAVMAV